MEETTKRPERKAAGTTRVRKKSSLKKKAGKSMKKGPGIDFSSVMENSGLIAAVVAVVIFVVILAFCIKGCGISQKSPESVVKSLTEAYADGKTNRALSCFGDKKEASEALKEEVAATIRFFDAHSAQKIEIEACDVLSEKPEYTYVYIIYKFVLEDGQAYPCISTYMVRKEGSKYFVVPPSSVTAEMSEQAITDYEKFMTTDIYKKYTQDYETFTKKNPGYEQKISGKVS